MRLSLLTHRIAHTWDLDTILAAAVRLGFAGVEFRVEDGAAHGVEIERTPAERVQIREKVQDACLQVAGIGTGSRLDWPDPAKRAEVIDQLKRYIEFAADLDCPRIRVFGNNIPDGVDRRECVRYVGESLRELGEFAEPHGVDVLLEMHGQFNYWGFSRTAVEIADHPRVALIYNCDRNDPHAGSIYHVYSQVRPWIRHVHMHDLSNGYPYPELFDLLIADGYDGYLSSELPFAEPKPDQYLALYATAFNALVRAARNERRR
jgi:sugar phosphate isomerase/epimerase